MTFSKFLRSTVFTLAAAAVAQRPLTPGPETPGTVTPGTVTPAAELAPQQFLDCALHTDEAGVVRAASSRFEASFAQGVATLQTPQAGGAVAQLDLSWRGYHRSGLGTVARPVAAEPGNDAVHYRRGTTVETYTMSANGFEQSFHFADRPAGHGDLVLEIDVGGNVHAPATERALHRALEFAFDGTPAIGYGEAFAYDAAGERIEITTSFDGVRTITLTVPAVFVDAAVYPLVVDPAVGPVLQLGGPGFDDFAPSTAEASNGVRIVVWTRQLPTGNGIRCQLIDANGNSSGPLLTVADGVGLNAPDVALCTALSQEHFLIVWQTDTAIRGRLVFPSAILIASAFDISSPAPGERDRRPSVGRSGTNELLVAWDRTAPGATNPNRIMLRDVRWPQPTQASTVVTGPERILTSASVGHVQDVEIAPISAALTIGGQTWAANRAVWQQFFTTPAPGDFDVRTMSFRVQSSTSQFAVVHGLTGVPGASDLGVDESNASIAMLLDPNGAPRFLVAWQDALDVRAHLYDYDAPIGSPIDVRATTNVDETRPAVGAGACEFLVGYLASLPASPNDVDVRGARVLADGTTGVTNRLVDDPGAFFQDGLAASSRPLSSTARRNSSLFTWRGFNALGISKIRARGYESLDAEAFTTGVRCLGPGGTQPAIGTVNGPAYAGTPNFRVRVDNAPPAALAVLVFGGQVLATPVPGAPGCMLYVNLPPFGTLSTVTDATGSAAIDFPIPCSVPPGFSLYYQWAVLTPGYNPLGLISSDRLQLRWLQ